MGTKKKTIVFSLLFACFPLSLFAGSNALSSSSPAALVITIILAIAGVVLAALLVFSGRRLSTLKTENTEIKTRLQMETERSTRLGTEVQVRDERIAGLTGRLKDLEARGEAERAEMKERIRELEKTRRLLEAEKERISAEDQQRRREDEENRDRMWNIHERESISRMAGVCRKTEIQLQYYDNTNLPEDLDPSLKPDFMIRLLGQYVIFDAKVSKSQNLQTYLSTQVKRTAEKLGTSKDSHLFYRQVFFVVPGTEVPGLKQTTWYEQGFTFFVISLDAFEPIVTAMKRLEEYEFTDRFDPQEREAIVGLIAAFEQHIRHQNAGNILSTLRGLSVLAGSSSLPGDMVEEVENRRKNIRIENFRPAELKKLIDDPEYQIREIARLVRPAEPDIQPAELDKAAEGDTHGTD